MKKITQRNLWAVGCAALVCGSAVMASAVVDKRHMAVDKAAKREALAVGGKAVGKAALPSRAVEADGTLSVPFTQMFNDFFFDAELDYLYSSENVNTATGWRTRETEYGCVPCFYLPFDAETASDNWLFTPEVTLEGGNYYAYAVYFSTGGYGCTERAELGFGKTASAGGMTVAGDIFDITMEDDRVYDQVIPRTVVVKADADGEYYLGVHGVSDADMYMLLVRGIAVSGALDADAPAPVDVFDVYRVDSDEPNATVKFVVPSATVAGEALASVDKMELFRDGESIKVWDAVAPGEELEFEDAPEAAGEYAYSIVATAGGKESEPVVVNAAVSLPFCGQAENVTVATGENGKVTISWDAPSTDEDGYDFGSFKGMKYRVLVTANDGSDPIVVGDFTDETSAEWTNPNIDKHMFYRFSVAAYNTARVADYTHLRTALGKPYELPMKITFNESVDDLSAMVNAEVFDTWDGNWVVTGAQGGVTSGADGEGDKFACVTSSKGKQAVLHTPLINVDADYPVLEFDWAGVGDDSASNLYINVVTDDGKTHELTNYVLKEAMNTWHHERVMLDDFGRQVVRVDFVAEIDNYYRPHVAIDNITVRSLEAVGAAVKTFTAPEAVKENESINFALTVENLGYEPLVDYVVNLYRDGECVASSTDNPEIYPLETAAVSLSDKLNMTQAGEHTYYAEIVAEGDPDLTDNKSADITVSLAETQYPTVEIAIVDDNGVPSLTWAAPDMSNLDPDPVLEDFENDAYPAFAIDAAGDWTILNFNDTPTYGVSPYAFENSEAAYGWILMNTAKTQPVMDKAGMEALSGTCYMGSMAHRTQSDAWLISPELMGTAQTVTFNASASLFAPETIEFYYSSTGKAKEDFEQLAIGGATQVNVPKAWTEYSVDLPEGAKYFAIRCVTTNQYMLKVDDITYLPVGAVSTLALTGYNVYRDGELVATTVEPSFADAEAAEGSHKYMVTAVYNRGESMPSNEVNADRSGIAGVVVGGDSEAVYYNLQGQRVVHPANCIFIEVKGGVSRKVAR